jgi:ABC-type glycerol-3-phosphate transport system substrate-binding protein
MKVSILSRKMLAVIVAAIVIVAVIAGVYWYTLPQEQIMLKIYVRDYHEGDMRNYTARYEKLHPNIKIELNALPWPGLFEKLSVVMIGGEECDMMITPESWWRNWARSGYIVPITEYLEKYPINRTDYKTAGLNAFNLPDDGKQYALPWRVSGQVLLYNVKAFEEVGLPIRGPETWDEFLDWCKKLMKYDDSGKVIRYGFAGQGNPLSEFLTIGSTIGPYAWAHGANLTTDNYSESNINKSAWVDAVKFALKVEQFTAPDTLITTVAELPSKLVADGIGMALTDLKAWDGCQSIDPNCRIGVARWPKGTTEPRCSPVIWGWIFPSGGKHTEEAFKFAHWLQEDPEKMARITPEVPATYSAGLTERFQRFKAAPYTMYGLIGGSDIAGGDPVRYHEKQNELINTASAACASLWADPTLDIQATLDAAAAEMNEILKG